MQYTKLNELELEKALILWFDSVDWDDSNLLSRNRIARTLKEKLSKAGHWKNKTRGKSKPQRSIARLLRAAHNSPKPKLSLSQDDVF